MLVTHWYQLDLECAESARAKAALETRTNVEEEEEGKLPGDHDKANIFRKGLGSSWRWVDGPVLLCSFWRVSRYELPVS